VLIKVGCGSFGPVTPWTEVSNQRGHRINTSRQEFGRLPWLALLFLRDFFLRPRLLMGFSNTVLGRQRIPSG
jgi:hypothetical protein